MKAKKITFKTEYPELNGSAGYTVIYTLKDILINILDSAVNLRKSEADTRTLWGVYKKIKADKDNLEVILTNEEYEILKQKWNIAFTTAQGVGYKWIESIDKIMKSGEIVELEEPKKADKPADKTK